ncbi:MAG: SRPBCC domain-containing protein [Bacteroidota bacterium]
MNTTDAPIIVEQDYQVSQATVWNALTRLDELKLWFFENIPAFEPKEGFETRFPVTTENGIFTHIWKVTEVIEEKKLSKKWMYAEYPGSAMVHFLLIPNNGKTTIRLTLEVLEDFPQNIPEFKRESGVAGWNYFLCERLKDYLEKC